MPLPNPPADLKRDIGFWGGIALMIGVIIGSGIFQTPPLIAAQFTSPGLILLLWAVGGLLCLAGAFTFAELAAMHPASGGTYVFIREAFGNCPAFVFGWCYLLLVKPFAAGGISFVFGDAFNQLLHILFGNSIRDSLGSDPDPRIASTFMLLSLTFINVRGVRLSTGFAGVLTALKFAALAAIIVLGAVLARSGWSNLNAPEAATLPVLTLIPALLIAMSSILWTYDGWADVGSVAGEVREPQRTLPRIYIFGTLALIFIYIAVNAVYFMLVPLPEMAALGKDAASIAPLVMQRLIGPGASTVVVLIILVSTLGSSHASIMTGARVSYAQARDGLLFRFIGHVHPRYATPDTALLAQVLLSIVAIWALGSFQSLLNGFVFTMWIFYGLAAAAIFVFRIRRPDAPRPFRCPGYPVVPAVFVVVAAAMTLLSIVSDPGNTLPWIGVLLFGVPVYYVWRRLAPTPASLNQH